MDRCWILLGMMGAGKSTVGRLTAELLGLPIKDTDQLIQQRFGRPIHQIFSLYGEEAFREHETSILRSLEPGPYILATGGGIVLRPENWEQFRRLGRSIFIDASPERIKERLLVSKKRRPLLETENWTERFDQIYETRHEVYLQADIRFEVKTEKLESVAEELAALLRAYDDDQA